MSARTPVLAAPAEVDAVIALMAAEPLCPSFLGLLEQPGDLPYEGAARVAVRNPDWNHGSHNAVPEWIDGDPIHPKNPDARRFFGNFFNVSRVFCIDTDDEVVIARLRAAITTNMQSAAFRAALAHSRGAA